jgi:cobalt-zinc-cadmium resistance protein CzcA
MIERIVQYSIRHKVWIGLCVAALIGWGVFSLTRLPVDAIPDITNNQIQIIALAPSLAVQEVESAITAPIEVAVANIPDQVELRSISRLGLSVITVVFKDHVDPYWARQQLNERLREAEESIPQGLAKIELAPVSSGLGEIYQYRLAVQSGYEGLYDPMELRTLQDWTVRREMLGTPGVADINSYGGFVKEYEVAVSPDRLRSMGLTLNDLFDALEKNNENTGSAYIDKSPNAYFIRGIGMVKSLEDVGNIAIRRNASGIPVRMSDVATIHYGHSTRYGAFVVDTAEAVGGVVMMLKGANAREVVRNVEERMKTVQKSLPKGVVVEPFLNRSELVQRTIRTVSHNLVEGALIVLLILMLLLGDYRAGLIVASVIPLSMLFAVSLMRLFGISGNLMSLGAIDFGLIVDGAVIIVESVVHRTSASLAGNSSLKLTRTQMDENVRESTQRMMGSATFGQLIILVVYLPILALVGIEGKMFRPMAQVVVFALTGATLLSLTYVPVVCSLFLNRKPSEKTPLADRFMSWLQRKYNPLLAYVLRHKRWVVGSTLGLLLMSGFVFTRLGGEFIPQLEEGDLAAGVMTLQGGSLEHTVETVREANRILLNRFPEITHAVCKIGAGEIPTDPTPMETGDYILTLKDKSEWTSAHSREELVSKMEEALIPLAGVKFEFQQPIQMRFNELLSGSRQDVAVKLFGDDLNMLSQSANRVEALLKDIPGVEDLNVERVTGLDQLQVRYKRDMLSQYGLTIEDANRLLRTAYGGSKAGVVFEEEKRFGLVVRLDKDYRSNPDEVGNLSLTLPNGTQIPLSMVADVSIESGPAQVSRENTKRRITIGFNVRHRDVQTVVDEATRLLDQRLHLPPGYYVSYGGQFQNLQAASARLFVVVPIALLLILLLLYATFHSLRQSILIFASVPFSVIGGILALALRGMDFSISAGVGFIALFGVAVLNGIVLIAEFNRLEQSGITDINARIHKGLHSRLRPVLITASVASLGFLPMALSTSAGAEVQKPLATVVIGGLISATLLTLLVLPVFYALSVSKGSSGWKRLLPWGTGALLLFVPQGAKAQALRVDEAAAVRVALDSNLSVRASYLEQQRMKVLKGASVDLGKMAVEMHYGQVNSDRADHGITLSQTVEFPTVYVQEKRLAESRERSSQLAYRQEQRLTIANVRLAYWEVAYRYALLDVLRRQDSLYTDILEGMKARVGLGDLPPLERTSATTNALEIRNRLQQTLADRDIALRRLGALLNASRSVSVADTILRPLRFAPVSGGIQDHPEAALSRQEWVTRQQERRVEEQKLLPDLTLGYVNQTIAGTLNGKGLPYADGHRFQSVQVGVALPLFSNAQRSRIQAAKLEENAQRLLREDVEKNLNNRYKECLSEWEKQGATLRFYEQQALGEARSLVDQSRRSYRSGAISYTEHAQNLLKAAHIQEGYLETVRALNLSVIQLDYLTSTAFEPSQTPLNTATK